jgi:hypothetical protein
MIILLQFVLTALACAGLWWAWTRLAGHGKASLIVAAGFVIRALAGQLLFWISWLRLPIARSLQLGNGFWFFAIDGPGYLAYSKELIDLGPKAILFISTAYKSRLYTQAFTLAAAAFGVVSSVAILFNCAAYLATCAIILRLGSRDARMERPRLVTLVAIVFGPGMILWSLQALKDTFFFFLIAALIGLCFQWQEMWREGESPRWRRLLSCSAAMIVVIYAIGGMRWYFAAFFCALWPVFIVLTMLPARSRSRALLAGAVMLVLLSQALRLGGSDDIPWQVRRLLAPGPITSLRWWRGNTPAPPWQPSAVPGLAVEIRSGFEHTLGATMIATGPVLAPPQEKKAEPLPRTLAATLTSGFAAMFLPRFVAQSVGLIHIGGGRGFWFFAEVDTLVFDAVLLFVAVYCIRALRTYARVTPLFVLLVLLFLMTAGPMMYTVTNFGTLFRLRLMVYFIAAILPLTLASREEGISPPHS